MQGSLNYFALTHSMTLTIGKTVLQTNGARKGIRGSVAPI